jgi:hypothetical protein
MELVFDRARTPRSRARPLIECGQCGVGICMPEWTEELEDGRIRHLWRCEACDYAFETTARFFAAVA